MCTAHDARQEDRSMRRRTRWLGLAAIVMAVTALARCGGEVPEPIQFNGNRLSVFNLTPHRWSNVEVWLNNHYRVTLPRLEAGQRFDVPLDAFVAGNGHRFQPKNQMPVGIQVLAKSADGTDVKINWGKGRQWY
jgi:hypothetical protein